MKTQQIVRAAVKAFLQDDANGVDAQLGIIEDREGVILPRIVQWYEDIVPVELVDGHTDAPGYPHLLFGISASENQMRQKWSYFAGPCNIVTEIRTSIPDFNNLVNMSLTTDLYCEAIVNCLMRRTIPWQNYGINWVGTYRVQTSPPRAGGENYLQAAQISWDAILYNAA